MHEIKIKSSRIPQTPPKFNVIPRLMQFPITKLGPHVYVSSQSWLMLPILIYKFVNWYSNIAVNNMHVNMHI